MWIGIHRRWDSQKVRKASVEVVEASMEACGSFHGINFRRISESFHGNFQSLGASVKDSMEASTTSAEASMEAVEVFMEVVEA